MKTLQYILQKLTIAIFISANGIFLVSCYVQRDFSYYDGIYNERSIPKNNVFSQEMAKSALLSETNKTIIQPQKQYDLYNQYYSDSIETYNQSLNRNQSNYNYTNNYYSTYRNDDIYFNNGLGYYDSWGWNRPFNYWNRPFYDYHYFYGVNPYYYYDGFYDPFYWNRPIIINQNRSYNRVPHNRSDRNYYPYNNHRDSNNSINSNQIQNENGVRVRSYNYGNSNTNQSNTPYNNNQRSYEYNNKRNYSTPSTSTNSNDTSSSTREYSRSSSESRRYDNNTSNRRR